MSTVNVSRAFVATNPVFPNEIRVVEEQADGTILVTRARYDGAYASARHNNLRMPPRSEWEAGGWRNHESYVPVTGFNTIESCRQHFDQVCGDLIVDIVL